MLERRTGGLEVRAEARTLHGYALVYGAEARIARGVETIAPGAVAATLAAGTDVLALVDHDAAKVIGRTRTGTLELRDDGRGLAFTIQLPDTSHARDVLALAERGDLGGMSFGFRVPPGGDEWRGDRRTLRRIDLHEISVVTSHPAYAATTVEARAAGQCLELARKRLRLFQ